MLLLKVDKIKCFVSYFWLNRIKTVVNLFTDLCPQGPGVTAKPQFSQVIQLISRFNSLLNHIKNDFCLNTSSVEWSLHACCIRICKAENYFVDEKSQSCTRNTVQNRQSVQDCSSSRLIFIASIGESVISC